MSSVYTKSLMGMSHTDWLMTRRKSIGGSDASALVGLNKWATPYTVWADKVGALPEKEDTEAMRCGRDLEDYVAKRWSAETGKRLSHANKFYYNRKYPYSHALIDRRVQGESAGLECKTTSSLDIKQFANTEFPEQYYAQCVHYLAVTGFEKWYLAVLVYGRGFFTYELDREDVAEDMDALMKAESEFWRKYVITKSAPPADGEEATADALNTIFKNEWSGQSVGLTGYEETAKRLLQLKEQSAELKKLERECENILKDAMQTAEEGILKGYKITWKTQERKTLDAEALKLALPDFNFDNYYRTTKSRVFRVKAIKGEDT